MMGSKPLKTYGASSKMFFQAVLSLHALRTMSAAGAGAIPRKLLWSAAGSGAKPSANGSGARPGKSALANRCFWSKIALCSNNNYLSLLEQQLLSITCCRAERVFGHLPGTPTWQKPRRAQYNLKFTALPLKQNSGESHGSWDDGERTTGRGRG